MDRVRVCSRSLGGNDQSAQWGDAASGDQTKWAAVTLVVAVLLLLASVAAALWVLPRLIFRPAPKPPSRVPQEWVDEFNAEPR